MMDDGLVLNLTTEDYLVPGKGGTTGEKGGRWTER